MAIEFMVSGENVDLYFENEKLLNTTFGCKLQLSGKDFLPKFEGTNVEDINGDISFYIYDLPEELSSLSAIVLDNINKSFRITLMTSYFDRDSWARSYSFSKYISQLEALIPSCIPPIKPFQKTDYFEHSNISTLAVTFMLSKGNLLDYVLECANNVFSALAEADNRLTASNSTQDNLQLYPLALKEGTHCGLEEDQTTEFKEVNGKNPKQSIQKPLDKYILSFLNSEGGSIYWGITNNGIVKSIKLSSADRDDINKVIASKIYNIEPAIDPTKIKIIYHEIENMDEHYVLQIYIPKSRQGLLHFNKSNETWVRLNGVSQILQGVKLQEYIREKIFQTHEIK